MDIKLPDSLQRNKELYWALRTRVLTNEELEEVQKIGSWIVIEWRSLENGSATSITQYKELEQELLFNNALLNQFKMRLMKEQAEKGTLK